MLQMFYQKLSAKFLNSTFCAVYCSGAPTITGPAETTTLGSTLFWFAALACLSTHRHTNMVRFKGILILNSTDYKLISYFFWRMLAHMSCLVLQCTQPYYSECTPE